MSHIYEHLNKGYFLPLFIFSKLLIKFLWNFPVNYVDVRTKIYKMYQICVAWDIPTKLRVNNQLGISLTVWQSYQEVTIKCPWEFLGVSPGILLLDAHINSHCPHLGPWCSSSQQDFFFFRKWNKMCQQHVSRWTAPKTKPFQVYYRVYSCVQKKKISRELWKITAMAFSAEIPLRFGKALNWR